MDYIVIEGVSPWDGRYEFDLGVSELTTREWGWIRRYSGYMPLTAEDGFRGADPELFASFALVALVRAGKVSRDDIADVMDRIIDAPALSTIRFDSDTAAEGADAGPPPPSSDGSTTSSGDDSAASSVSSTGPRNAAGTHGSASSVLAPARSGS